MQSYRNRSGDVVIDEHFLEEDVFVTATSQKVRCPVSVYFGDNSHDMTSGEARWLGTVLIKSANLAERGEE